MTDASAVSMRDTSSDKGVQVCQGVTSDWAAMRERL